jgi:hypothetical protein
MYVIMMLYLAAESLRLPEVSESVPVVEHPWQLVYQGAAHIKLLKVKLTHTPAAATATATAAAAAMCTFVRELTIPVSPLQLQFLK